MANTYKAHVEYEITNVSQMNYNFSFPYLKKKFVKVSVKHAEDNSVTNLSYGINYLVLANSSITLVPDLHLKVGDTLVIDRVTSTDSIVSWTDASVLIAKDLTLEQTQMLHLMEEQEDYLKLNSINTTQMATGEKAWNANNSRITNVGIPKDQNDVVTKGYMESVADGFVSRNTAIENDIHAMHTDITSKKAEINTAVEEGQRIETRVTEAENNVRQNTETVQTLVNTASQNNTAANQSATSASSSADMAHKWAVATTSPDNLADTESTSGKTMSSRSWALQSKASSKEAEQAKNSANISSETAKNNADRAVSEATKAISAATKATEEATRAKEEADKAKAAADRIGSGGSSGGGTVSGNYLSLDTGGTVNGKTTFTQNVTLNGTPTAATDSVNKKYVDYVYRDLIGMMNKIDVPKVTVEGNTIAFGSVKIGVD